MPLCLDGDNLAADSERGHPDLGTGGSQTLILFTCIGQIIATDTGLLAGLRVTHSCAHARGSLCMLLFASHVDVSVRFV